ncbi:hypothetical protein [Nocardioides kribbensis]|uniref:hypothetical protein n=1 Tax=Nocardioides kribbensis TaxID=305517 RepID=UPI0032DACBC8
MTASGRPLPGRTAATVARLGATALALVVALTACTGGDDAPAPSEPTPSASPAPPAGLADLDTTTLAVTRGDLCPTVDPAAVEDALGGAPADAESYANGQRVELTGGVRDVAHEWSCTWSGAGREAARAWVFAPPVPKDRARQLVRTLATADGCARPRQAEEYGAPSLGLVCEAGPVTRVQYAGLFGDAWLSCSLTLPRSTERADLLERGSRWCAAVALAGSATS